jgi:iron complex outermembrane receptor protein
MSLRVKGRLRMIDVLLIAALAIAGPLPAFATETHQFEVPVEDAPSAIRDFASQAHVQILVAGENVREKHLHPVSGEFSTEQGLQLLLADSGLSPQYVGDRSIALVKASDANSPSQINAKEGKNSFQDFRLAQVDQGKSSSASSVANQASSSQENSKTPSAGLEEIIVTAQKRAERLQDVPVPVTALSADSLVSSNQLRLQDYFSRVPGLNMTPNIQSSTILSIRGVTTGGATNPTVGVTVDDMPYGSSTSLGGGLVVPDIDPGDLARIEVLRGPQGTLYGASSMGGLLKFVTVDPSTDGVSGRVQAGVSGVQHGDGVGYNVRGSINLPLSDALAVRASAFTRETPGYINDPAIGAKGVNEERVSGGRLSGLWRPSDDFSLKLAALYQKTKGDGSNDVDVPTAGYPQTDGLGDLQQNKLRGTGGYDRTIQAYSATLAGKFANVDWTAISGYNVNQFSDSLDFTYKLGPYTQSGIPGSGFNGFGVSGTPIVENNKTDKFTQEIRLSGPIGERFDWLLGGFYTHEKSEFIEDILAADPATGAAVATFLDLSFPTTYTEYAGFTDLTVHFTDRFDVQLGARESKIKQSFSQSEIGPYDIAFLGLPSPVLTPELDSSSSAFTYLVTPRFRLSPDLMLYARFASGYRAGGANTSPGGVVPVQYDPDKTQNYELGAKGDFLDHTLSVDTSVYYIDWKDIQLQLINPANYQGYNANGGRAKTQGVELSVESRPVTGLTLAGWVAFNDAKLTASFPVGVPGVSAYGLSGDRLPYSSRFSGNLSADQSFPLTSTVTGFAGASVSYLSDREGVFTASPQRQTLPAYAKTDLRAGLKFDAWTADLFINNVADKRGVLTGGLGNSPPYAFTYIQPRTAGISIERTF